VTSKRLLLLSALGLFGVHNVATAGEVNFNQGNVVLAPDGKGGSVLRPPTTEIEQAEAVARARRAANGVSPQSVIPGAISYHGGPIMLGTTWFQPIYYGWPSGSVPALHSRLSGLVLGLNGSSYFSIVSGYYDGNGNHVSNSIQSSWNIIVPSSPAYGGNTLSDASVWQMVSDQLSTLNFPFPVQNGVFVVISGPSVQESSGFCGSYCGWHSNHSFLGNDIKFAFVGDTDRCPQACATGSLVQGVWYQDCPSSNCAADGIANFLTHEIAEAITDPDGNAWYDSGIHEIADKCNLVYGPIIGGSKANSDWYDFSGGGFGYEIQELWIQPNGGCAMSH